MATVYVARDLKHERDVHQVLRAEVASAVGVDRFLAEINKDQLIQPASLPLDVDRTAALSGVVAIFLAAALAAAAAPAWRASRVDPVIALRTS